MRLMDATTAEKLFVKINKNTNVKFSFSEEDLYKGSVECAATVNGIDLKVFFPASIKKTKKRSFITLHRRRMIVEFGDLRITFSNDDIITGVDVVSLSGDDSFVEADFIVFMLRFL